LVITKIINSENEKMRESAPHQQQYRRVVQPDGSVKMVKAPPNSYDKDSSHKNADQTAEPAMKHPPGQPNVLVRCHIIGVELMANSAQHRQVVAGNPAEMLKSLKASAHNARAWPVKLIMTSSNFNCFRNLNPDLSFTAKVLRKQLIRKATASGPVDPFDANSSAKKMPTIEDQLRIENEKKR